MSSITINIINGTPPYVVEIQPGDVFMSFPTGGTKIINDLSEGEYTIILTDNVGCEDDANVSLQTTTTTTTLEPTTTTTSSTTTTTTTQFTPVEYGALYNWYAATDTRNITASGWHVGTETGYYTGDWPDLATYLGGWLIAGSKLKETGIIHWQTSNSDATNETGFNGRAGGMRLTNGNFSGMLTEAVFSSPPGNYSEGKFLISNNAPLFNYYAVYHNDGVSIRLVKNSTTLSNGQTGTYTGNDGKIYPTICIGTQEWLACNLNETKFRNGDWIHGYELGTYTPITNANWAALTSEGMSYYNDLESNG